MTLQEYELLPDDGSRYELCEGELIQMSLPKLRHTQTAKKFERELTRAGEDTGIGEVYVEAGFLLVENPPTLRGPDVAFVRKSRVQEANPDGWFSGAPDLAVEVVSPSESADDLRRKIEQYLGAGATAVWVAYSSPNQVHVYKRGAGPTILSGDEILDEPDLFPGWSTPIDRLFA